MFLNSFVVNGAVVMCLPPFVDLAVENRKLFGQSIVEVKHSGNRVRLCHKVLCDRIFEVCPVVIENVLGINPVDKCTSAIVALTVLVAVFA